jgi:hypothetical protein
MLGKFAMIAFKFSSASFAFFFFDQIFNQLILTEKKTVDSLE